MENEWKWRTSKWRLDNTQCPVIVKQKNRVKVFRCFLFSNILGLGRKWKLRRSQMEAMWACSRASQLHRTRGQLLKNGRRYSLGWLYRQSADQDDNETHLQSPLRKGLQTKDLKKMPIDQIQWMVWEASWNLWNRYHSEASTNLGT